MEEMLISVTDRTIPIFIPDPASTTGQGKTGLVAANLTAGYTRYETDNDVIHTDGTSSLNNLANLTAAHNDWGWLEVSSTLAPGEYRFDLPDAVFASGAWYCTVYVMITSGTAAATVKAFRLVAVNALDGVRQGMTALPNAVPGEAGGGFIAGTNAATTITTALTTTFTGNLTGSAASVTGAVGSVAGNVGGNVTGSVGSVVGDTPQTGDSFARIGALGAGLTALASQASVNTIDDFLDTEIAAILAAVDTEVAAIKAKTDSLTFTVAGQVDSNLQAINDVALLGDGAATPWGPV